MIQIEFNDIDQLISQRQEEVKKEKSQIGYGLLLLFAGLIFGIIFLKNNYIYGISLVIGMIIGITLRYSRFCFAAAFRDPFITGNTRVLRGVILGLIVATIGFGAIQYRQAIGLAGAYDLIPGAISPVGTHVMIGAFIFGIGMVLAGGCASGLLMRVGEGHTIHLVVLIGFIIGSLLGAKDYGFWYNRLIKNAKTIYFPNYIDLRIVIMVQVVFLIGLYRIAIWYEKKHAQS